jgi:hypothetical protein
MRSLWVGGYLAAPVSSTSSIGSVNGSASSKRNGRVVVRGLERRGRGETTQRVGHPGRDNMSVREEQVF